jgi:putative methionine-R-sulfoxide reductase with GAF domain
VSYERHRRASHVDNPNNAGFYTLDPSQTLGRQLVLGPFQGKVACQVIAFGRGVCGTAAQTRETQIVPDVDLFPGHIACDGDSQSEIVVPIVVGGKLVAIIDVDCASRNGFDETDRTYLERLADVLGRSCDW